MRAFFHLVDTAMSLAEFGLFVALVFILAALTIYANLEAYHALRRRKKPERLLLVRITPHKTGTCNAEDNR